jgi:transcriptional regulator with XRE-family HTH domain
MHQIALYNPEPSLIENRMMAKTPPSTPNFGKQLARLRKDAGYTQQELANEIGATRRMIAYYEAESDHPPTNLLVELARALKVTTDELLGLKKAAATAKAKQPDSRLLRRLQQIEKLDTAKKRQIMQVIDTFIEHEQLKQKQQRTGDRHANV